MNENIGICKGCLTPGRKLNPIADFKHLLEEINIKASTSSDQLCSECTAELLRAAKFREKFLQAQHITEGQVEEQEEDLKSLNTLTSVVKNQLDNSFVSPCPYEPHKSDNDQTGSVGADTRIHSKNLQTTTNLKLVDKKALLQATKRKSTKVKRKRRPLAVKNSCELLDNAYIEAISSDTVSNELPIDSQLENKLDVKTTECFNYDGEETTMMPKISCISSIQQNLHIVRVPSLSDKSENYEILTGIIELNIPVGEVESKRCSLDVKNSQKRLGHAYIEAISGDTISDEMPIDSQVDDKLHDNTTEWFNCDDGETTITPKITYVSSIPQNMVELSSYSDESENFTDLTGIIELNIPMGDLDPLNDNCNNEEWLDEGFQDNDKELLEEVAESEFDRLILVNTSLSRNDDINENYEFETSESKNFVKEEWLDENILNSNKKESQKVVSKSDSARLTQRNTRSNKFDSTNENNEMVQLQPANHNQHDSSKNKIKGLERTNNEDESKTCSVPHESPINPNTLNTENFNGFSDDSEIALTSKAKQIETSNIEHGSKEYSVPYESPIILNAPNTENFNEFSDDSEMALTNKAKHIETSNKEDKSKEYSVSHESSINPNTLNTEDFNEFFDDSEMALTNKANHVETSNKKDEGKTCSVPHESPIITNILNTEDLIEFSHGSERALTNKAKHLETSNKEDESKTCSVPHESPNTEDFTEFSDDSEIALINKANHVETSNKKDEGKTCSVPHESPIITNTHNTEDFNEFSHDSEIASTNKAKHLETSNKEDKSKTCSVSHESPIIPNTLSTEDFNESSDSEMAITNKAKQLKSSNIEDESISCSIPHESPITTNILNTEDLNEFSHGSEMALTNKAKHLETSNKEDESKTCSVPHESPNTEDFNEFSDDSETALINKANHVETSNKKDEGKTCSVPHESSIITNTHNTEDFNEFSHDSEMASTNKAKHLESSNIEDESISCSVPHESPIIPNTLNTEDLNEFSHGSEMALTNKAKHLETSNKEDESKTCSVSHESPNTEDFNEFSDDSEIALINKANHVETSNKKDEGKTCSVPHESPIITNTHNTEDFNEFSHDSEMASTNKAKHLETSNKEDKSKTCSVPHESPIIPNTLNTEDFNKSSYDSEMAITNKAKQLKSSNIEDESISCSIPHEPPIITSILNTEDLNEFSHGSEVALSNKAKHLETSNKEGESKTCSVLHESPNTEDFNEFSDGSEMALTNKVNHVDTSNKKDEGKTCSVPHESSIIRNTLNTEDFNEFSDYSDMALTNKAKQLDTSNEGDKSKTCSVPHESPIIPNAPNTEDFNEFSNGSEMALTNKAKHIETSNIEDESKKYSVPYESPIIPNAPNTEDFNEFSDDTKMALTNKAKQIETSNKEDESKTCSVPHESPNTEDFNEFSDDSETALINKANHVETSNEKDEGKTCSVPHESSIITNTLNTENFNEFSDDSEMALTNKAKQIETSNKEHESKEYSVRHESPINPNTLNTEDLNKFSHDSEMALTNKAKQVKTSNKEDENKTCCVPRESPNTEDFNEFSDDSEMALTNKANQVETSNKKDEDKTCSVPHEFPIISNGPNTEDFNEFSDGSKIALTNKAKQIEISNIEDDESKTCSGPQEAAVIPNTLSTENFNELFDDSEAIINNLLDDVIENAIMSEVLISRDSVPRLYNQKLLKCGGNRSPLKLNPKIQNNPRAENVKTKGMMATQEIDINKPVSLEKTSHVSEENDLLYTQKDVAMTEHEIDINKPASLGKTPHISEENNLLNSQKDSVMSTHEIDINIPVSLGKTPHVSEKNNQMAAHETHINKPVSDVASLMCKENMQEIQRMDRKSVAVVDQAVQTDEEFCTKLRDAVLDNSGARPKNTKQRETSKINKKVKTRKKVGNKSLNVDVNKKLVQKVDLPCVTCKCQNMPVKIPAVKGCEMIVTKVQSKPTENMSIVPKMSDLPTIPQGVELIATTIEIPKVQSESSFDEQYNQSAEMNSEISNELANIVEKMHETDECEDGTPTDVILPVITSVTSIPWQEFDQRGWEDTDTASEDGYDQYKLDNIRKIICEEHDYATPFEDPPVAIAYPPEGSGVREELDYAQQLEDPPVSIKQPPEDSNVVTEKEISCLSIEQIEDIIGAPLPEDIIGDPSPLPEVEIKVERLSEETDQQQNNNELSDNITADHKDTSKKKCYDQSTKSALRRKLKKMTKQLKKKTSLRRDIAMREKLRRLFRLKQDIRSPAVDKDLPSVQQDSLPENESYTNLQKVCDPEIRNDGELDIRAGVECKSKETWKHTVLSVLHRLRIHNLATRFLKPVNDAAAPMYSKIVKQPTNLTVIKEKIKNGTITTTQKFERELLLMLTNAIMYNSSDLTVHNIAKEFLNEVKFQLEVLKSVLNNSLPPNLEKARVHKKPNYSELRSSISKDPEATKQKEATAIYTENVQNITERPEGKASVKSVKVILEKLPDRVFKTMNPLKLERPEMEHIEGSSFVESILNDQPLLTPIEIRKKRRRRRWTQIRKHEGLSKDTVLASEISKINANEQCNTMTDRAITKKTEEKNLKESVLCHETTSKTIEDCANIRECTISSNEGTSDYKKKPKVSKKINSIEAYIKKRKTNQNSLKPKVSENKEQLESANKTNPENKLDIISIIKDIIGIEPSHPKSSSGIEICKEDIAQTTKSIKTYGKKSTSVNKDRTIESNADNKTKISIRNDVEKPDYNKIFDDLISNNTIDNIIPSVNSNEKSEDGDTTVESSSNNSTDKNFGISQDGKKENIIISNETFKDINNGITNTPIVEKEISIEKEGNVNGVINDDNTTISAFEKVGVLSGSANICKNVKEILENGSAQGTTDVSKSANFSVSHEVIQDVNSDSTNVYKNNINVNSFPEDTSSESYNKYDKNKYVHSTDDSSIISEVEKERSAKDIDNEYVGVSNKMVQDVNDNNTNIPMNKIAVTLNSSTDTKSSVSYNNENIMVSFFNNSVQNVNERSIIIPEVQEKISLNSYANFPIEEIENVSQNQKNKQLCVANKRCNDNKIFAKTGKEEEICISGIFKNVDKILVDIDDNNFAIYNPNVKKGGRSDITYSIANDLPINSSSVNSNTELAMRNEENVLMECSEYEFDTEIGLGGEEVVIKSEIDNIIKNLNKEDPEEELTKVTQHIDNSVISKETVDLQQNAFNIALTNDNDDNNTVIHTETSVDPLTHVPKRSLLANQYKKKKEGQKVQALRKPYSMAPTIVTWRKNEYTYKKIDSGHSSEYFKKNLKNSLTLLDTKKMNNSTKTKSKIKILSSKSIKVRKLPPNTNVTKVVNTNVFRADYNTKNNIKNLTNINKDCKVSFPRTQTCQPGMTVDNNPLENHNEKVKVISITNDKGFDLSFTGIKSNDNIVDSLNIDKNLPKSEVALRYNGYVGMDHPPWLKVVDESDLINTNSTADKPRKTFNQDNSLIKREKGDSPTNDKNKTREQKGQFEHSDDLKIFNTAALSKAHGDKQDQGHFALSISNRSNKQKRKKERKEKTPVNQVPLEIKSLTVNQTEFIDKDHIEEDTNTNDDTLEQLDACMKLYAAELDIELDTTSNEIPITDNSKVTSHIISHAEAEIPTLVNETVKTDGISSQTPVTSLRTIVRPVPSETEPIKEMHNDHNNIATNKLIPTPKISSSNSKICLKRRITDTASNELNRPILQGQVRVYPSARNSAVENSDKRKRLKTNIDDDHTDKKASTELINTNNKNVTKITSSSIVFKDIKNSTSGKEKKLESEDKQYVVKDDFNGTIITETNVTEKSAVKNPNKRKRLITNMDDGHTIKEASTELINTNDKKVTRITSPSTVFKDTDNSTPGKEKEIESDKDKKCVVKEDFKGTMISEINITEKTAVENPNKRKRMKTNIDHDHSVKKASTGPISANGKNVTKITSPSIVFKGTRNSTSRKEKELSSSYKSEKVKKCVVKDDFNDTMITETNMTEKSAVKNPNKRKRLKTNIDHDYTVKKASTELINTNDISVTKITSPTIVFTDTKNSTSGKEKELESDKDKKCVVKDDFNSTMITETNITTDDTICPKSKLDRTILRFKTNAKLNRQRQIDHGELNDGCAKDPALLLSSDLKKKYNKVVHMAKKRSKKLNEKCVKVVSMPENDPEYVEKKAHLTYKKNVLKTEKVSTVADKKVGRKPKVKRGRKSKYTNVPINKRIKIEKELLLGTECVNLQRSLAVALEKIPIELVEKFNLQSHFQGKNKYELNLNEDTNKADVKITKLSNKKESHGNVTPKTTIVTNNKELKLENTLEDNTNLTERLALPKNLEPEEPKVPEMETENEAFKLEEEIKVENDSDSFLISITNKNLWNFVDTSRPEENESHLNESNNHDLNNRTEERIPEDFCIPVYTEENVKVDILEDLYSDDFTEDTNWYFPHIEQETLHTSFSSEASSSSLPL